jgi:hypothetical protein
MRYDADKAPDPDQWLELDEHDRIDLVGSPIAGAGTCRSVSAATRVIVENQVAMGDATVVRDARSAYAGGARPGAFSSRSFSMSPLARMITMPTSIPNMAASSAG